MILVALAIVGGVLAGLALGGSLRTLGEIRFRWWPLAILGLALQLIPARSQSDRWLGVGLLIVSYAILLIFVVANLSHRGFGLIGIGFVLNLLVISVNGGMPVSDKALHRAAGSRYEAALDRLIVHGGAKHHLQRSGDDLVFLADVYGVPGPVAQVVSIGDVIAMVGVGWVMGAATKRGPGRHAGGAGSSDAEITPGSPAAPLEDDQASIEDREQAEAQVDPSPESWVFPNPP
jgi:hypothetical protein